MTTRATIYRVDPATGEIKSVRKHTGDYAVLVNTSSDVDIAVIHKSGPEKKER